MRKILLGLISIFTFASMSADNSWQREEGLYGHLSSDFFSAHQKNALLDRTSFEVNFNLFQDGLFKISPNPSKNRLNIKLPKSFDNMTVEVFDVLGKRVHKSVITNLDSTIDVSRWKTGVYLVKVSNDIESQTKRFIKQ